MDAFGGAWFITSQNADADAGSQAFLADQEPPLAEQENIEAELQRGPEIADVSSDTSALKLGPAKIRILG